MASCNVCKKKTADKNLDKRWGLCSVCYQNMQKVNKDLSQFG